MTVPSVPPLLSDLVLKECLIAASCVISSGTGCLSGQISGSSILKLCVDFYIENLFFNFF